MPLQWFCSIFPVSECVLNTTVTWFWCFYCITSAYCHIVVVGLHDGEPRCHVGTVSTFVWIWKAFPGCWLRHWPNTICADPEQIAKEPSPRRTQNTMFCGTNAMRGFVYVDSDRPQLHFPTVWRMSKRGLLTITCHTLDVFRVLKCSLKHFFSGMEI